MSVSCNAYEAVVVAKPDSEKVSTCISVDCGLLCVSYVHVVKSMQFHDVEMHLQCTVSNYMYKYMYLRKSCISKVKIFILDL